MNNIEQTNEPLVVLMYTLITGHQRSVNLTRNQVKEFIVHFLAKKMYVVTSLGVSYGLNPDQISDFRVKGIYQREIKLYIGDLDIQREEIASSYEKSVNESRKTDSEIYKIECKCGAAYTIILSSKTFKGRCNGCGETLFVDRKSERRITHKGLAMLMTNKYFVNQASTT
ncbi:hypothetical protein NV379_02205 [Paenibacillus sp. N1-5-1-14]|uniref:hypothetical protein n=1 Tax=Paenibacillus radicibacter TaxID=2972488 RepID=UPI0021593AA5|nr:hypothetical protein [Paenibacillus radicibacter]MCR8641459.1 hypothetical protein [Paenibacillus radicibacter]